MPAQNIQVEFVGAVLHAIVPPGYVIPERNYRPLLDKCLAFPGIFEATVTSPYGTQILAVKMRATGDNLAKAQGDLATILRPFLEEEEE